MLAVWEPPAQALVGFNSNLKLFNIPVVEPSQTQEKNAAEKSSSDDECMSTSSSDPSSDGTKDAAMAGDT